MFRNYLIKKSHPVKVKRVGPDHPEPVEGVQPEQEDQDAHDDAARIAGVCWIIWGRVIIPSPVLVIPSPCKARYGLWIAR